MNNDHEVLSFITRRRSVRAFTGQGVTRQQVETILKAAMAAPSARNLKPWRFYVSLDPATVKAVCAAHPHAPFGDKAGAVVVPFGSREGQKYFDQDFGAATENLLLAVANLGLGATWCGMDDGRQEAVNQVIGLPGGLYSFAVIPIGYPAETPQPRTQFDPDKVVWERFP